MKKIHFLSLAAIAFAALSWSACSKKAATASAESADSAAIAKVRVEQAVVQDVPQTAEFTTTVLPENKNSIAGASGRIKKLFVEVGDRVVKGQKLVQMDDANVANLKSQIINIRTTYSRLQELFAVGGTSQQDLDNAKLQLDMAETNLKTLEDNTFLLSPINGVVTARYFDEGDLFSPSQYPIYTVMQINPLKLKVNVSESYYSKVKKGMVASIVFDVLNDETYEGRINLIYPTIDEITRTFTVEIGLANNNQRVRPGMYGRVTLNFGVEQHVVIPDKAVIKQQGTDDRYVYILTANNTVRYQRITLGKRLNNRYEILSGVNNGEKVVTEGISALIDGRKVEVITN